MPGIWRCECCSKSELNTWASAKWNFWTQSDWMQWANASRNWIPNKSWQSSFWKTCSTVGNEATNWQTPCLETNDSLKHALWVDSGAILVIFILCFFAYLYLKLVVLNPQSTINKNMKATLLNCRKSGLGSHATHFMRLYAYLASLHVSILSCAAWCCIYLCMHWDWQTAERFANTNAQLAVAIKIHLTPWFQCELLTSVDEMLHLSLSLSLSPACMANV